MRRLLSRLALFLPIPALIVAVNVWIDPANIKDEGSFEALAASMLLSGRNVANLQNCNERLLVKFLVEGTSKEPEVLVLGSSRAMQISSLCFPGRTFFNGAISGAQVEDFLAVYALIRRHGFDPKTVVVTLDGSLLNPGDTRDPWNSLSEEQRQMEEELGFREAPGFGLRGKYRRYLELASPVYFQQSLKALLFHDGLERRFWAAESGEERAQVRRADGSLVYGEEVRRRGVDEVNREAMQFATKENALFGLGGFTSIDEGRLARLERFIAHLRARGVTVVLFVPPYHPIVYRVISTDPEYALVLESERRFHGVAAKFGVEIAGAFDPAVSGVAIGEFHDGMHPKREAVERILGCGSR